MPNPQPTTPPPPQEPPSSQVSSEGQAPNSTEDKPETPSANPPADEAEAIADKPETPEEPPEADLIVEPSEPASEPEPTPSAPTPDINPQSSPSFIQKLLIKARAKIQERKQKKLEKIMELLETKPQITNQDIQKLLRVSSATSTRYLEILEKQNKIKQVGNTGKAVFYSKI